MRHVLPLLIGLGALACAHDAAPLPQPRTARRLAYSYALEHDVVPTAAALLAATLSTPEVRERLQTLLSPEDWSALQDTAAALAKAPLLQMPPLEELPALSRLAESAPSTTNQPRPLGLRALWALLGEPSPSTPQAPTADLDAADSVYAALASQLKKTPAESLALIPNVRVLTQAEDSGATRPAFVGADWATVRAALQGFHWDRARLLE